MAAECAVSGPRLAAPHPTCLGCHQLLQLDQLLPCPSCGLPLCRTSCGATARHQQECRLVRSGKYCIIQKFRQTCKGWFTMMLYNTLHNEESAY